MALPRSYEAWVLASLEWDWVLSHVVELTATQRYADHSSATMKLFLDAKASADTLLDLCMLHIQVNSKQQLYICYWSWYTNWVNWFHPASVRIFSKYRAIQNGKKFKLQTL